MSLGPHRGRYPNATPSPDKIGLPPRPFLYTLDQLSVLLDVPETTLKNQYVHFEGRSIGVASRRQLLARNIAPDNQKPDWRVVERELIRWFKAMGYKYYDRGSVTH